jgi:hypothetical protein
MKEMEEKGSYAVPECVTDRAGAGRFGVANWI